MIEESSGYKVQGQVIEADAHHNLAPVSAAVTLTNRISPVNVSNFIYLFFGSLFFKVSTYLQVYSQIFL